MGEPVECAMVDEATLRAIVAMALPLMKPMARRICANRSDADDLVQDVLETAMVRGLRADLKNPVGFLITSLHNRFIDYCRRARRTPLHEPLVDGHDNITPIDSADPVWASLDIADVRQALEQVGAPFREVYELHCFAGQSYDQIAAQLNISAVTVGTRLSRVRQQLRKILLKRVGGKVKAKP